MSEANTRERIAAVAAKFNLGTEQLREALTPGGDALLEAIREEYTRRRVTEIVDAVTAPDTTAAKEGSLKPRDQG